AGGNAGGVAESVGAKKGLLFRMDRAEDVIGELSRDDVGQMAGAADEVVMLVGSDAQRKRADGSPEVLDYTDGVVGGIGSWRYSADGLDEKISAGVPGAGFLRAG